METHPSVKARIAPHRRNEGHPKARDAIQFGLTGQIGRLTGQGSKNLSIAAHGPHVDATNSPGAAFVKLRVFLTRIRKFATITRSASSPKKPKIEPPDTDVKDELAEIANYPEIALSRREILRFIVVEASKRSEEVQALLKLDGIGQVRLALHAAQKRLQRQDQYEATQVQLQKEALERHLQTPSLSIKTILDATNARRAALGLPALTELTSATKLDDGLSASATNPALNKESALQDLEAFSSAAAALPNVAAEETANIVSHLRRLEADPPLLVALQRRSLIEKGLDLVDGPECPLCDTPWPSEQHLRDHLKLKLAKSEEAQQILGSLLKNGAAIAAKTMAVIALLAQIQKIAQEQQENRYAQLLTSWKASLEEFQSKLSTFDGLVDIKDRLEADGLSAPSDLLGGLQALTRKVSAIPDQTATFDAQTFLWAAQTRLSSYQTAKRKHSDAGIGLKRAKISYDTYCEVMEDELSALYKEVEEDFRAFYRTIHGDDEAEFTTQLAPTEGKLELGVDFYGRGLFPPTAYHSEGHQDSMGVCLYLALMKRQLGNDFALALLDDVVTSVDSGHRRKFCTLLKEHFPNVQFIVTTHERLWAEQLRSAGLVSFKTLIAFQNWTVDDGPLVESSREMWSEIDAALAKGKVSESAAMLRRHLEHAFRQLAHTLGARPQFHVDGSYELGDLKDSVLARMNELYGKAAEAAQSWNDLEEKLKVETRKASFCKAKVLLSAEQWTVNKAVHDNSWANFSKNDFQPVVNASRSLLACFRCDRCESWLSVTPRSGREASLRCDSCGTVHLNFTAKPKQSSAGGSP